MSVVSARVHVCVWVDRRVCARGHNLGIRKKMGPAPRTFALLALACLVGQGEAFAAGSAARRLAPARRSTSSAMSLAPLAEPALQQLPELFASQDSILAAPSGLMQTTVTISDAFDLISGFANSPLILLVPMGAGTLVAAIIATCW